MDPIRTRMENIKEICNLGTRLFVFGAGVYARKLFEYWGGAVEGLIDGVIVTDTNINPKLFMGYDVFSLDSLDRMDQTVVVVAVLDNEDICHMLAKRGFRAIIPIQNVMPIFGSDLETWMHNREKEVKRFINQKYNKISLFSLISIETINRCNGECLFCPVNRNSPQRPYNKMSSELFYTIVDQLCNLDYNGIVGLFSNNEPFLDDRICEFAEYARDHLPKAFIYLKTNGTLVTMEKFRRIIWSLDKFGFDNYLSREMPQNVADAKQYCEENGIMEKFYYYSIDKDAKRSSRGGNAPNRKIWYTLDQPCELLFNQMIVRSSGEVSLCCNDALEEYTLGNVMENGLKEIWEGDVYRQLRERMFCEGRYGIDLCRHCDHIDGRDLWEIKDFMS